MPLFGARAFTLRIPGGPTGGPFGANKLVYHDEFLATEIGQVGTQFDGLGHIGIQLGKDGDKSEMHFYNGLTAAEISDAYGLKKLGVEKLKPLFTRGHLVDIQAVKGGMMDAGQEITRRRRARRAAEAEHAGKRHQAGRRDPLQHRLGLAVDEEQRPLQQRRAGHRPGGRALGDREGSLPDRRRHLGGRGRAQPGQEPRLRRSMPSCRPSTASSITRTWCSTS